jgi:hypothetical protein
MNNPKIIKLKCRFFSYDMNLLVAVSPAWSGSPLLPGYNCPAPRHLIAEETTRGQHSLPPTFRRPLNSEQCQVKLLLRYNQHNGLSTLLMVNFHSNQNHLFTA